MKSFKKIICFILTGLFIFVLVGCNNKDKDNKDAESAVKKYLNLYYNVDKADIELYEKMMSGMTEENENEVMDEFYKSSEKFKAILTDKDYVAFINNRLTNGRIREAYNNKCYVTVKDIKLEKYTEDKKENMIGYSYDIELNETSISSNKVTVNKRRNTIHVYKVKNTWKVAN